jgi:hypothetical protein
MSMSMSVAGTTGKTRRPPGRPCRLGSPEAAAADRDRRRYEYADLRAKLAMPSKDLAALLGFTVGTVEAAPYWSSPTAAPTDKTLGIMRRELLKRSRERIEELRAWREIELAEAEAQLADHMQMCRSAEPEGLDDETEEAA